MNDIERIELLTEAQELIREARNMINAAIGDTRLSDRADAYLLPELDMAVDNEHHWLGKNQFTVQDAIDALRHTDDDNDPDDDTPVPESDDSMDDIYVVFADSDFAPDFNDVEATKRAQIKLLSELEESPAILRFDTQELLDAYKRFAIGKADVPLVITPTFKALAIAGYIEMTMFHISTGMKTFIITEAGYALIKKLDDDAKEAAKTQRLEDAFSHAEQALALLKYAGFDRQCIEIRNLENIISQKAGLHPESAWREVVQDAIDTPTPPYNPGEMAAAHWYVNETTRMERETTEQAQRRVIDTIFEQLHYENRVRYMRRYKIADVSADYAGYALQVTLKKTSTRHYKLYIRYDIGTDLYSVRFGYLDTRSYEFKAIPWRHGMMTGELLLSFTAWYNQRNDMEFTTIEDWKDAS